MFIPIIMEKNIVQDSAVMVMKIIAVFSIAISATVILFGWYLGFKEALSIIPAASTMKFNTHP